MPLALPKLPLPWLLIGEWPELLYDDIDAGVKAGVSIADADEVMPGSDAAVTLPKEGPVVCWKLGGLPLDL